MKGFIYSTIAILFLGGIAILYLLQPSRAFFAKLTDPDNNEVLVVGESDDRMEDMSGEICWRKDHGPWMIYYLGRNKYSQQNLELLKSNNTFVVKYKNQIIGRLHIDDGKLELRGKLYDSPDYIVVNDDPFCKPDRLFKEGVRWNTVWPSAMGKSNTVPFQKGVSQ